MGVVVGGRIVCFRVERHGEDVSTSLGRYRCNFACAFTSELD